MATENARFYLSWGCLFVMLGLSILIWFQMNDSAYAASVFFLGFGAFISMAALKPKFEGAMLGLGLGLLSTGAIILSLVTTVIQPIYVVVGIIIAFGFGIMLHSLK